MCEMELSSILFSLDYNLFFTSQALALAVAARVGLLEVLVLMLGRRQPLLIPMASRLQLRYLCILDGHHVPIDHYISKVHLRMS